VLKHARQPLKGIAGTAGTSACATLTIETRY
jgi:hypothetical protein